MRIRISVFLCLAALFLTFRSAAADTIFSDNFSVLPGTAEVDGGGSGSRIGDGPNVDDPWSEAESSYVTESGDVTGTDSDDYVQTIVSGDLDITRTSPSEDGSDTHTFPDFDDVLIFTRTVDATGFEGLTVSLQGAGSGSSMEASDFVGLMVLETTATVEVPAKTGGVVDNTAIAASSGTFNLVTQDGPLTVSDVLQIASVDMQPFEDGQFKLAVLVAFNNDADESYALDSVTVEGAVVPEPGSWALLSLGVLGLAVVWHRNGLRS